MNESDTAWLATAAAHVRAGRLDPAEAIYRRILHHQPRHPEANHHLGLLLLRRGQALQALPLFKTALEAQPADADHWLAFAEALLAAKAPEQAYQLLAQGRGHGLSGAPVDRVEARIRQALAAQPDLAPLQSAYRQGRLAEVETQARAALVAWGEVPALLHLLGVVLLEQRQDAEALQYLEQASLALGHDLNVLNQRALALNHLERFDEAHELFLRALQLKPDEPAVLINLGKNLVEAKRFEEAVPPLQRVLQRDPDSIGGQLNLANALMGLEHYEPAGQLLQRVLAAGHRTLESLSSYGHWLRQEGEIQPALAVFDEALRLEPEATEVLLSKSLALNEIGGFAEAEALLDRILARKPDLVGAWCQRVRLRKMRPTDTDWLERALGYLARAKNDDEAMDLHYALGKYYDDTREFAPAFEHYRQANAIKKTKTLPYDQPAHQAQIERWMAVYDAETVRLPRPGASPSSVPAFIVGMPRSGTSLTEQIIASHPATFGAGELRFWPRQVDRRRQAVFSGALEADLLHAIAEDGLAALRRYSATATRIVDKMPGNFHNLGLIHAVFPNARIIHTQRNPIDTCLSIYFQNFNAHHHYANDLEELAAYYRRYLRLMAHWRAVLPPEVLLEVPYEALVDDQEGWSRRIIAFLGLDWDERCLEFHQTERKVGTASNWQARQPLYTSSKDRWRHYEPFVGPLLPLREWYDPTAAHSRSSLEFSP